MIEIRNQPIPKDKFNDFHKILCDTGGRYICDPYFKENENQYLVSYIPGDYNEMTERLINVLREDVKEVRKDHKWRRTLRRYLNINC